ncbi:hypothetical protein J2754_002690 [Halarchaeum solikamskense]|nr:MULTISPECIES: hypothetical protein [Halobacteriaceae]MBP2252344.1 hypothetical protein [Halarchaeum solikamskense]
MNDTTDIYAGLTQWWMKLESGWQAVILGLLALTLVYAGVTIPW